QDGPYSGPRWAPKWLGGAPSYLVVPGSEIACRRVGNWEDVRTASGSNGWRSSVAPTGGSRYNGRSLMRGGAVWQLVGLITRRSQVQILPPLPSLPDLTASGFDVRHACRVLKDEGRRVQDQNRRTTEWASCPFFVSAVRRRSGAVEWMCRRSRNGWHRLWTNWGWNASASNGCRAVARACCACTSTAKANSR